MLLGQVLNFESLIILFSVEQELSKIQDPTPLHFFDIVINRVYFRIII